MLHPWLQGELTAILAALPPPPAPPPDPAAARAAWAVWQEGLSERFTLPADLPPLRVLLVWDNLAGHQTPDLVCWLCAHGVMPLYTPLGGSWLNMAESVQRILVRRALAGQHPQSAAEVMAWLAATVAGWNAAADALRVGRRPATAPLAGPPAAPRARRLRGRHASPRPPPGAAPSVYERLCA